MEDDEFDVFFQTMTVKDLKEIVTEFKEVKGLSKYRKADLIEAFINLLSEEEQEAAYKKWMPKKIQDIINRSIDMLTKWGGVKFNLNEDTDEYSVDISWQGGEEDRCTVVLDEGELKHECSCRLGERGGICVHLVGLIELLYLKGKIRIEDFPFTIDESWLGPIHKAKAEISNNLAEPNDADIDMNEYWLFISGDTITSKWSGEYAGTNTININEYNAKEKAKLDAKEEERIKNATKKTKKKEYVPVTVEDWVVQKVVDKELESLKNRGSIREILIDRFGVIEKIFENEKQVERLQKAFKRAAEKFEQESYLKTPEEIREALEIGLIE
ncbi:MAG: hypothetical protein EU530_09130 [Promethearchaeota archaeon]|nr:MAG: hypothetical protein EU530_09130 [Candidatus Lokiarchaeota archaeon]